MTSYLSLLSRSVSRSLVLLLAFASAVSHAASPADDTAGVRRTFDFNPGWRVHVGDVPDAAAPEYDDAAWKAVTLPYAWNEDDAFRLAIDKHRTGVAWYRKRFSLPEREGDRGKVFLECEGLRQAGEFWINGQYVGAHENGAMAFGFDISAYVKPGPEENVIAVRTNNAWDYREKLSGARFQWADRNFNANYGGLTKNMRLHLTGALHQTLPLYSHLGTTGVYIYATDFDIPGKSATIHAESEVRFEPREDRRFTYDVTLVDEDGRVVKAFTGGEFTVPGRGRVIARAAARVEGLEFWSWGHGRLYTVTTTLKVDGRVVDAVSTRTGFRQTAFGDGVFKLNDRVLQIKGYAQRTSNEWPGVGLSVPPWLSDFSNGLMVESGANTVRWMHITPWKQDVESCDRVGLIQLLPAGDSEHDAQGRTWAMRVELMRDAIIYNRNSPSVVFYEAGNKGIDEAHMREMVRLRDQYDPHGGRAMGCREMLDSEVAEWGGEMLYINKSAAKPLFATEYSRDEGLRKYWDEFSPPYHKDGDGPPYRGQPAREYNRNQDSHAIENVVRWHDYWLERPGSGARVSSGGLNIIFSDTNTHYRGAENYRRSGEVDAMRLPKDGYFAHQVMWDGWVEPRQPRAHILGHWTYAPGVVKPVHVVSSAHRVELFLNDRPLGKAEPRHGFLFTFPDVAWEPGELRAVGYDDAGTQVCAAAHVTAGEPAALRLKVHTGPGGTRADGADLALIEVEVVDASGRRCPTAMHPVTFSLDGPAEWRGGIAQGPENHILSRTLPVECGVNRALVRSTTQAGRVVVTAEAPGLESAQVELQTKPVTIAAGLGVDLPGSELKGLRIRGATPERDTVRHRRLTVAILESRAGSNGDAAGASHDDDETTAWTSAGTVESAWIEYQLAASARLSEASFKLAGWRQRSYPVRILVDGREVYRGVTSRSLGYITVPLRDAVGSTVRVELDGSVEARDAFGIQELNEAANAGTGAERLSSRDLGIVEAEFYTTDGIAAPPSG